MSKLRTQTVRGSQPLSHRNVTGNLTLAELCLQRGDYEQGLNILERRVAQGATDFKTYNMYAVSISHGGGYDQGLEIFNRLSTARIKIQRTKASFNAGLVHFYKDLEQTGDMSVVRSLFASPSQYLTAPMLRSPFKTCLEIWLKLLETRPKYANIIHTYVAFAYFMNADLDKALDHAGVAITLNDSFYVTHYLIGRIFLDLYLLSLEGNDYTISENNTNCFEIEDYEIHRKENGRCLVHRDTFIDIAIQSLLEGRMLSPLCPATYIILCEAYLLAGLIEEAQDALAHAETVAPTSVTTLQTSLRFHEFIQAPPDVIRSIVERIKQARAVKPVVAYHIMPSYYLF